MNSIWANKIKIAFIIVFITLMAANTLKTISLFTAAYAEIKQITNLGDIAQKNESIIPLKKPVALDRLFNGLTKIGLFLVIPQAYMTAYECHDKELDCAKKNGGLSGFPEKVQPYIEELKDTYSNYPKALMPDNLTEVFEKKIIEQLSPFITHRDSTSEFKIETINQNNFKEFLLDPDALLIVVQLKFLDGLQKDQVVISRFYLRSASEFAHVYNALYRTDMSAINISKPEQVIENQLSNFAADSIFAFRQAD